MCFQATSAGLFPKTDEVPIATDDFYGRVRVGVDMIFNPPRTRFMRLVEKNGGKAFNGLKMLLYQGILAFSLWSGAEITEAQEKDALSRMRAALGQ